MEYETEFDRAVTERDVDALTNLKRALTIKEISALAKRRSWGRTALLAACDNAHYDVVQFLLDECNVDIEETSEAVRWDFEKSALHMAAFRGHLNGVELLLSHGAYVNAATKTNNETPLYLACQNNKLDVVKYLLEHDANIDDADSNGYTCLMVTKHLSVVNYLLSANVDVHKKKLDGETALHTCCGIRSPDSVDIFFALFQRGVSIHTENQYGVAAPIQAAIEGNALLIARLLDTPNLLTRKQIIEIQEVYGAYFALSFDDKNMALAFKFWQRALEERDNEPRMPKERRYPSAYAFGEPEEFEDAKQLRRFSRSEHSMASQAILVLERVLGPTHPFTTESVLDNISTLECCLRVFEMQQHYLQPLHYSIERTFSQSVFCVLYARGNASEESIVICFSKWIDHLAIGKRYLEEQSNSTKPFFPELTSLLCDTLHFGTSLLLPDVQVQDVWRKLVKLNLRVENGYTLLHLISSPQMYCDPVRLAPLNRKLLSVGVDPNARDKDGNTPLHLTAMMREEGLNRMELAQDLIDGGARMCASNHNGETFLDLVEGFEYEDWRKKFCSGKNIELACLAGRMLKKNKIPFEKLLPRNIVNFVRNH